MIGFVLHCARQQAAGAEFNRLALFIQRLHVHGFGRVISANISGKLKQPSPPATGSPTGVTSGLMSTNGMIFATSAGWPSNSSVDGRSLGLRARQSPRVERAPDLLGRQPDAVARLHRLKHVRDELFDLRRDFFNRRALLPQRWMAEFDDG